MKKNIAGLALVFLLAAGCSANTAQTAPSPQSSPAARPAAPSGQQDNSSPNTMSDNLRSQLEATYNSTRQALLNKDYQAFISNTAQDDVESGDYPMPQDQFNQMPAGLPDQMTPDLSTLTFIKTTQSGDWAGYFAKSQPDANNGLTLYYYKFHQVDGQWKITQFNAQGTFVDQLASQLTGSDYLLPGQPGYAGPQDASPSGFKRGDVVLAHSGGKVITTRIVGLPGETVQVSQGQVTVNGQAKSLPYFSKFPLTVQTKTSLASDEYLVVGQRSPTYQWDYSFSATIKDADIVIATTDQ